MDCVKVVYVDAVHHVRGRKEGWAASINDVEVRIMKDTIVMMMKQKMQVTMTVKKQN